MVRRWSRPGVARLAVGLAAALVVVGIGALLFSHLAVPTPGASGTTPSTTGDACLSPPATWDPRHASATQIASYGLPPRPPDSDPTAVSKWVQIVSHAKHRVCGPGQVGNPVPATPSGQELSASAAIEFDSGISYSTALRTITDLGLELADLPCPNGTEFIAGTPTRWQIWSPLAHPDDFTGNAAFIAFATPLAPTDWLHAIVAAPGVKDVRTDLSYNCPADVLATPPSGTLLTLGVSQPPAYARLIFGAGVSYDAALLAVSNLGLRLADPCREQVLAAGHGYPWQPAGQESAYAATHALMLASSEAASAQWQTQARALSGVTAVEVAPPITCPAG